jgi:hypothetical protein
MEKLTFGDYACATLGFIVLYILVNMIINLIWLKFIGLVKIHLPIPKKYIGKKSPIYKLSTSSWSGNKIIEKFNLKYRPHEGFTMLNYILFPFPFEWMRYGYDEFRDEAVNIEEGKTIESIKNLGSYYEKRAAIGRKQEKIADNKRNKKQNHIDKLNKEFKENYIK